MRISTLLMVAIFLLAQHAAQASRSPASPAASNIDELGESSPDLSARADGLLTQGANLSGAEFLDFDASVSEFVDGMGTDRDVEPSGLDAGTFGDNPDYSTARSEVLRFRQLMPRAARSDPHTLKYDSSGAVVSVRSSAAPPFFLFGQVPITDGMPGASAAILLAVAVTGFVIFRTRAR